MLNTVLLLAAIGLYIAATVLIAQFIRSPDTTATSSETVKLAYALGWLAVLVHIYYAYYFSVDAGQINFSASSMVVLTSGLVTLIYLLGGITLPIRRLGVIVFPLTVVCLGFAQAWSNDPIVLSNPSIAASVHIVVSILAYCLLAIASIQALLYVYQEKQIKSHATPAMLMALPPLQTMEQLLFRLIWTGFLLLSATLVSGVLFTQQIFNQPFEFNHHTILASIGWLVFAILLAKRVLQGLRGSQAVVWTIGGFALIQLGYFGTKIVSEMLNVQ